MESKIKSLIVEDEPGNVITLVKMLNEYCPDVDILGTAGNLNEAKKLIATAEPQLVFLDIEMPYGSAFDLLDEIAPVSFEVIFVTAFNNYAIQAIKYAALDYILKPVNIEELKKAVEKASERLREKDTNLRIEELLRNLSAGKNLQQKIALPVNGALHFELVGDITHMCAEGNLTAFYLRDNRKLLVSRNLKEYEDILPSEYFCRVHHSYIVNTECIKKYSRGRGGYLELENGVTIPVSERKRDDFLKKFM